MLMHMTVRELEHAKANLGTFCVAAVHLIHIWPGDHVDLGPGPEQVQWAGGARKATHPRGEFPRPPASSAGMVRFPNRDRVRSIKLWCLSALALYRRFIVDFFGPQIGEVSSIYRRYIGDVLSIYRRYLN